MWFDRAFYTVIGTFVRYDGGVNENGPKPSVGSTRPGLTKPLEKVGVMAVNQFTETLSPAPRHRMRGGGNGSN